MLFDCFENIIKVQITLSKRSLFHGLRSADPLTSDDPLTR